MKGFYQYLQPFAPDYSGAAAVLFGMGGLNVLCDPGGCSGNVCGYDEPRFYGAQTEDLYSAAIRDLDTIFGRDDALEKKVLAAASEKAYPFLALIGTPVVSVIGTDLKALCKGLSRKAGIPALAVETNGMDAYDKGAQKAYLQVCKAFAAMGEGEKTRVGVLGATPLDTAGVSTLEELEQEGDFFYGDAESLTLLKNLACVKKNVVVSPAGLKAARAMREEYGIPYETRYPLTADLMRVLSALPANKGAKILLLHQQMAANALRQAMREKGYSDVTVGTWFLLDAEIAQPGDCAFGDEEEFMESARGYDVIVGDPLFQKALEGWAGQFVPLSHFAVSGDLFR